jgi:hypothetical protein
MTDPLDDGSNAVVPTTTGNRSDVSRIDKRWGDENFSKQAIDRFWARHREDPALIPYQKILEAIPKPAARCLFIHDRSYNTSYTRSVTDRVELGDLNLYVYNTSSNTVVSGDLVFADGVDRRAATCEPADLPNKVIKVADLGFLLCEDGYLSKAGLPDLVGVGSSRRLRRR